MLYDFREFQVMSGKILGMYYPLAFKNNTGEWIKKLDIQLIVIHSKAKNGDLYVHSRWLCRHSLSIGPSFLHGRGKNK